MTQGNRDEDILRKKERYSAKEGLWNGVGEGRLLQGSEDSFMVFLTQWRATWEGK